MARLFLAILLALVSTGPAAARDLFQGVVSVGGGTPGSVGTNKARNVPDRGDTSARTRIEPGYDAS